MRAQFDFFKSPAIEEEHAATPEAVGERAGPRPYLKWAGGKRKVVPALRPILCVESASRRLVEPFAGSASVALALASEFRSCWLNDANPDLVNLHDRVARQPDELCDELARLFVAENNRQDRYYALREEFNENRGSLRSAALFVYLNRHGYNGLCRYNGSGRFNVPFGRYAAVNPPLGEIRSAAALLRDVRTSNLDFRAVFEQAGPQDTVYCDPPYVPLSRTASFTKYAQGDFGPDDQRALVEAAQAAATRGARVVISNHDTPETRELYAAAAVHSVSVRRNISQRAETRGHVAELLAVYEPRR